MQLLKCALWWRTLLIKTGPDIYVGQYWFFDSLTFFDRIKSFAWKTNFKSFSPQEEKYLKSAVIFDPVEKCQWIKKPILTYINIGSCFVSQSLPPEGALQKLYFSWKLNLNFDLEAIFMMEKFGVGTKMKAMN